MKLYNRVTHNYDEFYVKEIAGIYVCGITPYDSAHLGHIFTFMTYDLIQRRLEDDGIEVRLVRNITDVDEPIFKRAAELNIDYRKLARQETDDFQDVMRRLNFRPAFAEPKASEYIDQMADAIKDLLDKGAAYRLGHDIYFDVKSDPSYGSFSSFPPKLLPRFLKLRGGDPDRDGKRNPLDFLLWRGISDKEDKAAWDSIVGRGRPGWHIECTVMSAETLGIPLLLHGGGSDLIFPHHESEIAQARALYEESSFSEHWLHVAPLSYLGEKMSKSLGNLVFAKDLLKAHKPSAIRLALMHYHYREGGEWQPELLDEAADLLDRLSSCFGRVSQDQASALLDSLRNAIDNDLDTHSIYHILQDFCDRPVGDGKAESETLNRITDLLGIKF